MAIRRKGSRTIVVNGETYRWLLRRRPTRHQRDGGGLNIAISHADDNGGTLLVENLAHHASNRVGLRSAIITPAHIALLIRTALADGWHATESAPPFRLARLPAELSLDHAWPRGLKPLDDRQLQALERRDVTDELTITCVGSDVRVLINGVDWLELVATAEAPFIHRENADRPAADHLEPSCYIAYGRDLFPPAQNLLGEPSNIAEDFLLPANDPRLAKSVVMSCGCGNSGCWPLLMLVTMRANHVVWSDFEQFHRPWILGIGPFVFDRADYVSVLEQAGQASSV